MTFTAIVLVCTMIDSKPAEQQRCLQLTDTKGPHQTMQGCVARVAEIASTREVVGAAGLLLATSLQYGGPVASVAGAPQPEGPAHE
mgnify:CR=1 FL=1